MIDENREFGEEGTGEKVRIGGLQTY